MKSKDKNIINLNVGGTHVFLDVEDKVVREGEYTGQYPAKDYNKVGSVADIKTVVEFAEKELAKKQVKLPSLAGEEVLIDHDHNGISVGCTMVEIKDARKALNAMLKAVTK